MFAVSGNKRNEIKTIKTNLEMTTVEPVLNANEFNEYFINAYLNVISDYVGETRRYLRTSSTLFPTH